MHAMFAGARPGAARPCRAVWPGLANEDTAQLAIEDWGVSLRRIEFVVSPSSVPAGAPAREGAPKHVGRRHPPRRSRSSNRACGRGSVVLLRNAKERTSDPHCDHRVAAMVQVSRRPRSTVMSWPRLATTADVSPRFSSSTEAKVVPDRNRLLCDWPAGLCPAHNGRASTRP